MKGWTRTLAVTLGCLFIAASAAPAKHDVDHHKSSMFAGPKANTGTVSQHGRSILRVDCKAPDTPAPT